MLFKKYIYISVKNVNTLTGNGHVHARKTDCQERRSMVFSVGFMSLAGFNSQLMVFNTVQERGLEDNYDTCNSRNGFTVQKFLFLCLFFSQEG